MARVLKAMVTDVRLFNLPEDALAQSRRIEAIPCVQFWLPFMLASFPDFSATALGMTVLTLSEMPVIILSDEVEATGSDVSTLTPHS